MSKEKQLTLQKLILFYWLLLLGTVLLLLSAYGMIILKNSWSEFVENARIVSKHYGTAMDKDMGSMIEAVNSIFANNKNYRIITERSLDDFDWTGAVYNLNGSLQEKADSFDYMGVMFFYDSNRDSMRSAFSEYGFSGTQPGLNGRLRKLLAADTVSRQNFCFLDYEKEYYLVYYIRTRNTYLGFLLNLNRYFEDENASFAYVYRGTEIITQSGTKTIRDEDILRASSEEKVIISKEGSVLTPVQLSSLDMSLVVSVETLELLEIWKQPEFWSFAVLIPLLFILIMMNLLRKLRSIIFYPVEHILKRVEEMTPGMQKTDTIKTDTGIRIREYEQINQRIDDVLEQMTCLQEEKFRERQRVNEVWLQYYQLQINPHFFLNCLNTVSSLLKKQSADAAEDMIRSLSSYFRYVFRSQKNTVSVKEEIQVIRDYCNIYSLKGGFPIVLQEDVKIEAEDCRIPILSIQTFLENSIKYAVGNGKILTIKVQAGIHTDESGERKLSIRIADNGKGYPDSMMEELNCEEVSFCFRENHVGIDNLKYRLYLTFQDKASWYFYNSPYGGAITEIILPEVRI